MVTTEKGYFDIEQGEVELSIDELFYTRDVKQRKLFVDDEIMFETTSSLVHHILQWNREDAGIDPKDRVPILLYISSIGGDPDAAFALIDAIKTSLTPVYTINLWFQYSAAFYIGLAGVKRFSMPSAKFLMHDGDIKIAGTSRKTGDTMKFLHKEEDRIKDYVVSNSKITPEEYDEKSRVEWWMFADEAKEKGITDYIIGTDCSIEDIV